MKTTIEFKDGHVEVIEDGAPSVDAQDMTVCCSDYECIVLFDCDLQTVKRIIFEGD